MPQRDFKEKLAAFQEKVKSASEPEANPDSVGRLLVRLAQPFQRFDNPFFALELRLIERSQAANKNSLSLESGLVILFCALTVFVLIPILDRHFGNTPASSEPYAYAPLVNPIALAHLALCGCAAWWGSTRIFHREFTSGTINDVLLLPYAPNHWLWLKLAWPLFLLGQSWIAVWPIYFLTAITQIAPGALLFKVLLLPLWAGLALIGLTLLATPDYLNDPPRPNAQEGEARPPWQETSFALRAATTVRWILGGGFAFITLMGWVHWIFEAPANYNPFSIILRFYDFFAPAGWFWLVLHGAFFIAAFAHAGAMLSPAFEARRRAAAVLWSALASIYYTGLGFYWTGLELFYAWVTLLAAPLCAIVFSIMTARFNEQKIGDDEAVSSVEDGQKPVKRGLKLPQIFAAEREITYLAKQWDNAVFVKDVRLHLRHSSLRGGLVWGILAAGFYFWIFRHWGFAAISSAWWFFVQCFAAPGQKASQSWQQEARGVTLPMLLLSPLSSREIVQGRCWAGWLAGINSVLFGALFFAIVLFNKPVIADSLWPAILSAIPLPFLMLVTEAVAVPADQFSEIKEGDSSGSVGCLCYFLFIPSLLIYWVGLSVPLWVTWSLSLILFAFLAGATWAQHSGGIERLDKRRGLKNHRYYSNDHSSL